jgi:hypothetical protein
VDNRRRATRLCQSFRRAALTGAAGSAQALFAVTVDEDEGALVELPLDELSEEEELPDDEDPFVDGFALSDALAPARESVR